MAADGSTRSSDAGLEGRRQEPAKGSAPARAAIVSTLTLTVGLLLASLSLGAPTASLEPQATAESDCAERVDTLPDPYRDWLEDAALLMTPEERATFLCLVSDYERDIFIEEFWQVRDPSPVTTENELREQWIRRQAEATQLFEERRDERRRFYLLNGPPSMRVEICPPQGSTQIEAWFYGFEDIVDIWNARSSGRLQRDQFAVIFHRKWGVGAWRIWLPGEGEELVDSTGAARGLGAGCKREELEGAVAIIALINRRGGALGFEFARFVARKRELPPPPPDEWLRTFASATTDVAADRQRLDASVEVSFPGLRSSRAIVQGEVRVAVDNARSDELLGVESYAFDLHGRVLSADSDVPSSEGSPGLFERFRYRFEVDRQRLTDGRYPLVFQRYLRPGSYRFVLLVADVHSDAVWREELDVEVPPLEQIAERTLGPTVEQMVASGEIDPWDEANRGLESGEPNIEIVEPVEDLMTGFVRFETEVTGPIDRVVFSLDDRPVLTKRSEPFSVDLSLGELPESRLLRATAYDAEGREIASDAYLVNGSPYRFTVRLIQPVAGRRYEQSTRARVEVTVPVERRLEKLELFRNDELAATLYQPPFVQPIEILDPRQIVVVRALGHLAGGETAEDTVIVNGPPGLEQVRVDLVELYTTVTDEERRPLTDLRQGDFRVIEDGVEQEIVRFERVENTPVRVTILLDVSASMEERLDPVLRAAARFFESVVTERDRLSVVAFNDRPRTSAPFTNDREELAEGLLGLSAERGTALYDSLIYALFHLNGLEGQRAVLLLSDGLDEHSHYDFEQTVEYVRRSRAAVYPVAIGLSRKDRAKAGRSLERLARESGGYATFLDGVEEIDAVYDAIARELRSKYLIAYQSSNQEDDGSFRSVEVEVSARGAEAHTIRGYYP